MLIYELLNVDLTEALFSFEVDADLKEYETRFIFNLMRKALGGGEVYLQVKSFF